MINNHIKVLNVAVRVDGKKPIKCISRFTRGKLSIQLRCYRRKVGLLSAECNNSDSLELFGSEDVTNWDQLNQFRYSDSPCALLKACITALPLFTR
jgi:hypothetical protein